MYKPMILELTFCIVEIHGYTCMRMNRQKKPGRKKYNILSPFIFVATIFQTKKRVQRPS